MVMTSSKTGFCHSIGMSAERPQMVCERWMEIIPKKKEKKREGDVH